MVVGVAIDMDGECLLILLLPPPPPPMHITFSWWLLTPWLTTFLSSWCLVVDCGWMLSLRLQDHSMWSPLFPSHLLISPPDSTIYLLCLCFFLFKIIIPSFLILKYFVNSLQCLFSLFFYYIQPKTFPTSPNNSLWYLTVDKGKWGPTKYCILSSGDILHDAYDRRGYGALV